MKTKKLLLSLLFFNMLVSNSCTKDPVDAQPFSATVFTGQINADDAILVDIYAVDEDAHVYLYGTTNAQGEAEDYKSVAVKKNNSDTTYNFILDQNDRIQFMYSSVNGVKDSKLQKLTYTDSDSIYYSMYNYDWDTQHDSLIYMAGINFVNNQYLATTIYGKTSGVGLDALHAGAAAAGGALVAVAAVAALSLGLPASVAATGAIIIATAWFIPNAGAATLSNSGVNIPTSPNSAPTPSPTGTPANPSPCNGLNIVVNTSMDLAGSILIANPLGVSGYQYSVNNSPFQISQVFNGPYAPGSFLIRVKNAEGCIWEEVRIIGMNIPLTWNAQPIAYSESTPGACDAKLWWSYGGGVGPYTLYLSELGDIGQQQQPAEGITMNGFCISVGAHTVTVTDSDVPPSVITADVVF